MKINLYKPIYSYCYILCIVLAVWSKNQQYLPASSPLIFLVIVFTVTVLFEIIINLKIKNYYKSAFICFTFLVCISTYRYAYNFIANQNLPLTPKELSSILLPLWFISYYFLVRIVFINKSILSNITIFLNIFTFSLMVMLVPNVISFEFKRVGYKKDINNHPDVEALKFNFRNKPNIYYLIFDRYPSNDVLNKFFHFDNSNFLYELKKRGFYVVPKARSNYLKTALSLSSSLNMQHLGYLNEVIGENKRDWLPFYNSLVNYTVLDKLKSEGYRYVHMGSWWEPTRKHPKADINVNKYACEEFLNLFVVNSPLYDFFYWVPLLEDRYRQWKRIQYKFDELEKLISYENSQYIFGHFLIPHPPIVIHADGSFVALDTDADRSVITIESAQQTSFAKGFVEQVEYTNRRLLAFIDKALAQTGERPIIVIQADEGPFPNEYRKNQEFFDWTEASDEQLLMKTSILNAYLLPERAQGQLDAMITPVNTFRLIFSELTGAEFERLPDESYLFPSDHNLYEFMPITERIRPNITTNIEN